MKKTFYHALRAMCVGTMTLFAVSCYDDSELNGKLDNLSAEVQEIQAKLAELEADLNEQVTALTALTTQVEELDATVAAIKVETSAEGLTTVTLADGTKVVVSANGVVTIVNDGGKDYWAVVDQNGVVKNLNVLVGHELNFSVDPATFELMVNGNGTGAYVSVESAYVLGEVVETEDSVTLTIGDKTYTLAKKSATEFEIVSGKVYFTEGETKNLPLVVEGMKSSMIASCPKAWTAEVKDGQLSIKAPYGDEEVFENNGTVEVWVLTVDGTVLNGKVKVALTSDPAVVTYDAVNAVVTLEYDFTSDGFGSDGIFYGVCAATDFDAQAIAEAIEAKLNGTESQAHVFSSMDADGNNVKSANHKLDELLGSAPTPGVQYIIWTFGNDAEWVDHDGNFMTPSIAKVEAANEDFSKTFVSYFTVAVEASEPTFQDVNVNINIEGVNYVAAYYDPANFEGYPVEALLQPGMCQNVFQKPVYEVLTGQVPSPMTGMMSRIFFGNVYEGKYSGALSGLYDGTDKTDFTSGSTVSLVILPLLPGKETSEYTEEDVLVYNYDLATLTLNGEATVVLQEPKNVTYGYFEVPFSSDKAECVYYSIMPKDEAITDVEDLLDYTWMLSKTTAKDGVFAPMTQPEEYGYFDSFRDAINKDSEYTVVAFAVESNGACGSVVTMDVKTKDVEFSDALSVSVVGSSNNGLASAEFTISGPAVKLYYYVNLDMFVETYFTDVQAVKELAWEGLSGEWRVTKDNFEYTIGVLDLTAENMIDGKVKINDFQYVGNAKERVVLAFVQDKDGKISNVVKSATFVDPTAE